MSRRHATYAEFWPHYLREHARRDTRAIHAAGTVAGMALLALGLLGRRRWPLLAAPLAGYAAAWGSHMLLERNRPTTFSHPLWSLRSDLRMARLMLAGRLDGELRRASVGE